MISRRWWVGAGVWLAAVGCDVSRIERFESMPGAPRAVWALDFMPSGAPVVLGGTDTFGAKQLYRLRPGPPEVWEPAVNATQASEGQLFHHGSTLYFSTSGQLWRLDDEATFKWTQIQIPPLNVRPYWVDDTGRVYGIGQYGAVTWADGSPTWTGLPMDGPASATDRHVVDSEGTLYSTSLQYGISRFQRTGSNRVVDCAAPEFGSCQSRLDYLALDAADDLYFIAAASACRVRHGTNVVEKLAPTPKNYPYIHQLQAMADGTLFLTTAVNNLAGTNWAIFRLAPGGDAFTQITRDNLDPIVTVTEADRQYVVSQAQTIYSFGDGNFAFGVIRGSF